MATSKFRGLNVFIQDIRAAQNNADAERKRIDKEMANMVLARVNAFLDEVRGARGAPPAYSSIPIAPAPLSRP